MEKEALDLKLNIIKLNSKLNELKKKTGIIVQSLLFPTTKFTVSSARKWAVKHGYKDNKIDATDNFIHLTQKQPGRFNFYKTIKMPDNIQAKVAGNISKFVGSVNLKGFSKFSNVKDETEIKIPMDVELRVLCDGKNRDGNISREDLEESLKEWDVPIIDWHDMEDMKHPTKHKISDRKGFGTKESRIEHIDGKYWAVIEGQITDRYLAYLIYLAEKQNKPLEISGEYGWNKYWRGGELYQTDIQPFLITIVDQGDGHIIGNKLTIKSAS